MCSYRLSIIYTHTHIHFDVTIQINVYVFVQLSGSFFRQASSYTIASLGMDCLTFKTILLDLKRNQTNHGKNLKSLEGVVV